MTTRVQESGGSLVLRIPKSLAARAGLKPDASVEVSLEKGRLIVVPSRGSSLTLESLLAQVTKDNLHGEIDTGPAVGREQW